MFLYSAGRVQRKQTIETSFEGITRVFKELSSIIPKTSFSIVEMHDNRRFSLNKSLFLKEPHMFLCSACRVNECYRLRHVLKEDNEVSKSYQQSYPKYRYPFAECTKIDVSS